MIRRWIDDCGRVLGRATSRIALAAVCAGVLAVAAGILLGQARATLGLLTASWLFCAGLAAGGVALSAAVRVVGGRWADAAIPAGEAAGGFFTPALVLLAIISASAGAWMPPGAGPHGQDLVLLVARQLIATAILFLAGRRYLRRSRATGRGRDGLAQSAVVYLLLYAAVLSLWATDFVIAPAGGAPSTVVPALYFMGMFLGGIAWTTLVAVAQGSVKVESRRHDLGNMLFAFATFWTYLVWSSYLPVWYENMPDETAQLLVRWGGNWRFLTGGVLLAVFAFPFVTFFPEAARRGRVILAVGSAVILTGLLGVSNLFVLPSLALGGVGGWALLGAVATLGVLGLFLLAVGPGLASLMPAGDETKATGDSGIAR